MKQEKEIVGAVLAMRPNAKATYKNKIWAIKDGETVLARTTIGRRSVWQKALAEIKKLKTSK